MRTGLGSTHGLAERAPECPAPYMLTLADFGGLWLTLWGVCKEGIWGGPLSHVSLGDQWGHFSE